MKDRELEIIEEIAALQKEKRNLNHIQLLKEWENSGDRFCLKKSSGTSIELDSETFESVRSFLLSLYKLGIGE